MPHRHRHRRKAALVLAAGAAASIATSIVLPMWTVEASQPIRVDLTPPAGPLVLDAFATLTAALPDVNIGGSAQVELELQSAPTGSADAVVTLTLRRVGAPGTGDEDQETVRLAPFARTTVTLFAGGFYGCEASPCVEHYEVVLDPIFQAGAPAVAVDGTITASATGPSEDDERDPPPPPPGTAITLEVIPRAPS